MKRKRRKRRLMMDFMEFSRDTTRFRREAQYLRGQHQAVWGAGSVGGHRDMGT